MRRVVVCLLVVAGALAPGSLAFGSDDTFFSDLWGIERIGAPAAWEAGQGEGIVVAVVDSGVDRSHPDLRDNLVDGADFIDPGTRPDDAHGHGTHVAGTVGALAGNGIGVAGVAPRARIMPVRVLNEDGEGTLGQVEAGIRYAVREGAGVINLSLSGDVVIENLTGGSLAPVIAEAWEAGVVVVVAAGNDIVFPSGYRDVDAIVVSATGPNDEKPAYSNGVGLAKWGMAAPGGNSGAGEKGTILSTYWSTDGVEYAWAQGTSMATPHVSGAAAVLRGLGLSQQETVDRLLSTARDLGSPGRDVVFGDGRLDLAAAVQGLGGTQVEGEGQAAATPAPATAQAREPDREQPPAIDEVPPTALPPQETEAVRPEAETGEPDDEDREEEGVVAAQPPVDEGGGGGSGAANAVAGLAVLGAASGVALYVRRASARGQQDAE